LAGQKKSPRFDAAFELYRCDACRFAFVGNPCLDYEAIYDEAYYLGKGAERKLDFIGEMENPSASVRNLEWQGLKLFADSLGDVRDILDYGCGSGLLASYLNGHGYSAEGWDTGWLASRGRDAGFPILTENPSMSSKKYDLIFAIEVIEHNINPLEIFREFRSLLRPGGIVFLTTGDASPWWDKLTRWEYFAPEIHVSLFTPDSLRLAFEKTGFISARHEYSEIFEKIVLYKILKNLYIRKFGWKASVLINMFRPFCRSIDRKYGVSAMSYGIAK
jgi:2-polyprenyl-3-methyl-5-hydroxy-6-metoxy-1,4-benzoquinol methylase